MKKRIISMLLTVLMVMSLFSGLPLSAYAATTAGANTIEYTMAAGDYVLRICQKFGLNYYTCKDAIMILNNIYDGQWNKLAVGRTLILPASDNDAILIANGAKLTNVNSGANATTLSTGTAATYTTGTATTGTSVATTTTFKSADGLAYYLVPYTMSAGENVSGVCNSLGVNFNIFSPFIKQVNGISDWTKVRAGQTLIIPTPVCPSVGTTCYGVMQHKVTGSDTAYGIATSNGVNYNASKTLLEVLNQTNNLASLTAGQWFYYPVPLTVSVPGTGNPGSTATTTTTTTTTDGNGTTTTTSTTTSKLYKLTSGMSASDGTMLFYVNNQAVTAAPAGAKVTIVTDTKSGKAIQSLTVKQSDGKADFLLTNDSFIMPGCDVRVDAAVKNGHDINIEANYSGKAMATVGGVTVMSAVKGATVIVKSNDPNYEISNIFVYYKKLVSASNKTAVTVSSSHAFIMPDNDVTIEVTLKPVSTYAFYVNDPANGTFYLKVDGSPVTRAAKGAQVTVVATAKDGYEPVSLDVRKHTDTTQKVNVFNNTFTMPGFDVDVTVEFGAKGNNIVIMPSQFGNVYAFDKTTGITDASQFVTEANTGADVYLVAINEEVDPPVGIKKSDYDISYDVVRNSDGLKVKVEYVGDSWTMDVDGTSTTSSYFKFTMPKGGVTVTPIITSKTKYDIVSKFYKNGVVIPKSAGYADCSFSVTWDGKTSSFTETEQWLSKLKQIKSAIPAGEYIDLRYDCDDGVVFVKYRITNGKAETDPGFKVFEEATNEANLHGYFKMPAEAIEIEAYFETGNVPIGPAVIEGIGSVGYKRWDTSATPPAWKSTNTAEPGDTVLFVVTAGNGYKFDDSKYDTKLLVTRKDNGAPLTLSKAGPGLLKPMVLDENTYAYYIENMPASGVDVRVIFDPKPFVITMKCVDETGRDLTGQGLWQIAIDWIPGVVDNGTNVSWFDFVTKFDVAYGDYVTVAMTEAGWSKYDMVSFRIDGLEYTADQLNYFYNFQMIDDRAKNLTITAVLRPKNVGIHTLSAIYDTTKLGVEFLIIDSPTGYSDEYRFNNSGALNYLNKAVTGDKVAIVANAIDSKYSVTAKDISITPFGTDADRIVPTEEWINEYGGPGTIRVFTFTMPDADVYVQINVSGTQHGLSIGVYDAKDNAPVNGMVRLFATTATGATVSRDVGANNNFDDIPYKSVVQILRSELALAEGKVIKDVEIKTLSGKSINYTDMTSAGEGIYFTMPDEPVWVVIRIDDQHYNIPTVVVTTQVKNGTLVYRKSMNETDPIVDLEDFKPGEIVYVFDVPDEGYAHLGLGDLKIYVNGMNNAVNVQKITTVPHVWSFTMPEGTIIMKADFPEKEAQEVTINYSISALKGTLPADVKVEVKNGDYTSTLTGATGSFKVYEGTTLAFTSATDAYVVYRLQAVNGLTSGANYKAPEDKGSDTLEITLAALSNPIKSSTSGVYLTFEDSVGMAIAAAETGDMVTVKAYDANGNALTMPTENLKITKLTDTTEIKPNETGEQSEWTFTMPAGGVMVAASYTPSAKALVTITTDQKIQISSKLGIGFIDAADSKTFEVPVGETITVTSATDGYDTVTLTAMTTNKGVVGNTYTVPSEAASVGETLDVKVTSSKSPITWSATGGTLEFKKGGTNVVAADPGETITITASKEDGYLDLETTDLVVTKKSDGYPVDDLNGHYPTWTFTMPAGGVNVTATFRKNNLVQVIFKPQNGNIQVTIDSLGTATVLDGATQPYELTAGTIVKIKGAASSSSVDVTSVIYGGTNSGETVSYVVPGSNDTLTIKVTSTAPAVTLKTLTNGAINLRKENDKSKPTYTAANFSVGDEIYLEVLPNAGYKLKADSLKVKKNSDDLDILGMQDASTKFYPITPVNIPEGGITISAEFEIRTDIQLAITVNGAALPDDVIVANVSTGNGITKAGATITATFGDYVTITPATGYKWDTGSMTVNGTEKTSFKVDSEAPYTIVLNLTTA